MSLGLLNNIASIYAQNNLNQTQASLQTTLQQLSSGSKINSGADDAAGLAVANGLHANVAALTQSNANVQSGVGLLQTADGALSQVTNLLNRAVTLSTEAANGTLNSAQVSAANQEYQNILTQINNIGSTTNFNGQSVFSATAKTVFVSDGTSAGADVYNETVGTLGVGSIGIAPPGATTTSALTNPTPTASTNSVGATATFALGVATSTLSGTLRISVAGGTAVTSTLSNTTIAAAVAQLNAQTSFSGAGLVASQGTGVNLNKLIITGPVDTSAGTSGTNSLSLTGTALTQTTAPTTTAGPGVNFAAGATVDVSQLTSATAQTVLTSVTSAIADVAFQRAILGAGVNQLMSEGNVAAAESVNLTSAESSVTATNYGQAASDMAKYQVLSQTGISALAQANSVQQEVLKLMQ